MNDIIRNIAISDSIWNAHKNHDQRRTLPQQLEFAHFRGQKQSIQQVMLWEIFKLRGYPVVLLDGTKVETK